MTRSLFDLTFWLAAPVWALMILAPRWHRTQTIVASPLICVPPLLIYATLVLPEFGPFLSVLVNPNLPGLQAILASDAGAAAAWAHFVGFDLFVGRWIYFDSRARGIHPVPISGLLLFTILFAPLGVLAYLLIRLLPAHRPTPNQLTHAEA
ncbi:ABA4-like family protein [Nocardia anaemiae]|uniref:ABA4-like family protein n=1 Tax=Nocardia anaemiae TaxID=263910 RepID=UPI0007A47F97|nr:ABA4-like family protein [Nocardia anaemiae]